MANRHRGEVDVEVPSGTWTLRFSTNAICELEDREDCGIGEIIARLDDPARMRMSLLRTLVWAGLRDKHPDLTVEQAGDIITDAGMSAMVGKLGEAFQLAFPDADGGGEARPPKRRGSGRRS